MIIMDLQLSRTSRITPCLHKLPVECRKLRLQKTIGGSSDSKIRCQREEVTIPLSFRRTSKFKIFHK
jgi:hypothetical protein